MLVLKEFYTVFKYYINHCLILKNNNALSKKIPTRSTNSTFVTFSGDFTEKSRLFSLDNKRQTAPIVVDIFQPIRKGQKYTSNFHPPASVAISKEQDVSDVNVDGGFERWSS